MKWFLVDKSKTVQPSNGSYQAWKHLIREEARRQCVYCATHEGLFGGLRNFHVEHYRPQKRFPQLANSIQNLFYSCGICNSFKGSSWPADPEPTYTVCAYPCPADIDYSDIFTFQPNNKIDSKYSAGRFVIERLFLNRPQLVNFRRFFVLRSKLALLSDQVGLLVQGTNASPDVMREVIERQASVMKLLLEVSEIAPYEVHDVKR
jgi:hypothetical protein